MSTESRAAELSALIDEYVELFEGQRREGAVALAVYVKFLLRNEAAADGDVRCDECDTYGVLDGLEPCPAMCVFSKLHKEHVNHHGERDELESQLAEEWVARATHAIDQMTRLFTPGHDGEEVGTGAGEGATGHDTGTAWVTRSTDYPEAPAQAHLCHNHPPYEPPCAERVVDGRIRGACLPDGGDQP